MERWSWLILALPVAVVLALAWLIRYRRAYWLIAGYNTMPEEKKRRVDTEKLGRAVSRMMVVIAAWMAAGAVCIGLGLDVAAIVCFAMLIPTIIYSIIRLQKYDGNTRKADGTMKGSSKAVLIAIVALFVLIGGGVGTMIYFGMQPAGYTVDSEQLHISGMYGESVKLSDMTAVELLTALPRVESRQNGSSLSGHLKGTFRLEGTGTAKLFVDRSGPPYVYIETSADRKLILNAGSESETRRIYDQLRAGLRP